MTRTTLVAGAALMVAALGAWTVFGQDEREGLCHNGHPVHRAHGISYGGLPVRHGFVRDHIIPLGLGGPDTASNVQYQRCYRFGPHGKCEEGPAADKDVIEHQAIGDYCSGRIELGPARRMVSDWKES